MPKYIAYHGTNRVSAISIIKNGFRRNTYFAKHLEDALTYARATIGLNQIKEIYIFGVVFDSETHHIPDFWEDVNKWQFRSKEVIYSSSIAKYFMIELTEIYENKNLIKNVSETHKVKLQPL